MFFLYLLGWPVVNNSYVNSSRKLPFLGYSYLRYSSLCLTPKWHRFKETFLVSQTLIPFYFCLSVFLFTSSPKFTLALSLSLSMYSSLKAYIDSNPFSIYWFVHCSHKHKQACFHHWTERHNNMEGGVPEADVSAFRECLALSKTNPYILHLAFSAGIGGLLFGYDTGKLSYILS